MTISNLIIMKYTGKSKESHLFLQDPVIKLIQNKKAPIIEKANVEEAILLKLARFMDKLNKKLFSDTQSDIV